MSTLQKLKAYFGMVPADELDDYEAEEYDRRGYRPEYAEDEFEDYPGGRRRWFGGQQRLYRDEVEEDYEPTERTRPRPAWTPAVAPEQPTHGALAVDARREPPAVRQRQPEPTAGYPLGRVITLHPRSYIEARTIGEHYRDGRPVIMNLTEMDDADAKRLVDFAAGLAFAMRGSMDKVTNKVFLISPPNVDPTAEDKRRLAEGGFATRS
ncbi:cell division protein SepF [Actinokineospora globicatena]|uniref:cell division protein SepF n=1 Tax=Actinokineospora globicatena TaxID=103729 RepID=UPI0020A23BCD|nr:cell division protein SepF [Actinokineospora globicatena]MCP2304341.1 cell division inhibitor SepF [Actinokineospora globicatena]GLW78295.1 cell division protein SepF [Actinokineospora globicatena]GLW85041.1 cell division protein SepF [Actinokineospora globicatena]